VTPVPPHTDDDLTPEELDRLGAAHELLASVEPIAERPPALETPPIDLGTTAPRRRRGLVAPTLLTASALAFLALGYVAGSSKGGAAVVVRTVELTGRDGAVASLAMLSKDTAGNWPMRLTVSGLAPLPDGQPYELWLTRDGELAESCGSFNVSAGETVVTLNAPYSLRDFTGWVVTNAADAAAFVLETESL
jgi:hypothetical protein